MRYQPLCEGLPRDLTNPRYVRGRNLEYLIKEKLENKGYFVTRSAGSHGIDLVALHQSSPLCPRVKFISCKVGGYIRPDEKLDLVTLARAVGAEPLMTEKKNGRWELVLVR